MNDNEKLLKIVKSKIYHNEIKYLDFIDAIEEAEKDRINDDKTIRCYECSNRTGIYPLSSCNGYCKKHS